MSNYIQTIPNLISGVSQQSKAQRSSSHLESQVNCYPTILRGLSKRPPIEYVAKLATSSLSGAFVRFIVRDKDEQFVVVITNGDLKVYNLDGTEETVSFPDGKGYLTATDPRNDFRMTTLADFSFIANTSTTIAKGSTIPNTASNWATVEILQAREESTYEINVDGSLEATYTTNSAISFSTSDSTIYDTRGMGFNTPASITGNTGTGVTTMRLTESSGATRAAPRIGQRILIAGVSDAAMNGIFEITGVTVISGAAEYGDTWDVSFNTPGIVTASPSTAGVTAKIHTAIYDSVTGRVYVNFCNEETSGNVPAVDTGDVLNFAEFADTDYNVTGVTVTAEGDYCYSYVPASVPSPTQTTTVEDVIDITFATVTRTVNSANTQDIVSNLSSQLSANLSGSFTVTTVGNTIAVKNNTAFTIGAVDDAGNTLMRANYNTVQLFSDLPADAPNGFIFGVEGDGEEDATVWYKFVSDASSEGEGYWEETLKPGLESDFDDSTMPHGLTRTSSGNWTFAEIDWADREVGQDANPATNPFPSFVGKEIADIFTYRGRLGILAEENIILSEAKEQFNWFRVTVSAILDSDRIDIQFAPGDDVNFLRYAIPFNKNLLIFSDLAQYIHGGDQLVTPKTFSPDTATAFRIDSSAKPILIGRNVYFLTRQGMFTGMREYFVDTNNTTQDAISVTDHVPSYIPRNVFSMTGNDTFGVLACLSSDETDALYMYNYMFGGGGGVQQAKLQSAWHKWTFGTYENIVGIGMVFNYLYIVSERNGHTYLGRIDLTPATTTGTLGYQIGLDWYKEVSGSYDAGDDETDYTVDYVAIPGICGVVKNGSWILGNGREITVTNTATGTNTTTLSVAGNLTGAGTDDVYMGIKYDSTVTLSTPFQKRSDGRRELPVLNGNLRINKYYLSYEDTAGFTVTVTPVYNEAGSASSTVGQTYEAITEPSSITQFDYIPYEGIAEFPVNAQFNRFTFGISSNDPRGFTINAAELIGTYDSDITG